MGNLRKDFWYYQYKGKEYFGITEVVGGALELNRKASMKYETKIEKALDYMLTPGLKMVSHMGIQKYNTYLNKTGRSKREDNEETFYPMFFELETKVKQESPDFRKQYKEMVFEAFRLVTFLMYEKGMEEQDILILLNNSRSVYVMLNPVAYGLRPGRNLHKIYKEMYSIINEAIDFHYIDDKMYKYNGLMKTPNCYYKGGYFVPISYEELKQLKDNPRLKQKLTKEKRSLDYEVPGRFTPAAAEIYETAKEKVKEQAKNGNASLRPVPAPTSPLPSSNPEGPKGNKILYIRKSDQPNCIDYILNNNIGVGKRNYALVSIAIHFKNKGYTQKQVEEILLSLSAKWGHDENASTVRGKVTTVFRHNTRFSCKDGARHYLGLDDDFCKTCPFNRCKAKENKDENKYTKFRIQKTVINELWERSASLRHYKAYLELSRKRLFGHWFSLETVSFTERTMKELCRLSSDLILTQNGDSVMIYNKALNGKNQYLLPNEFWDDRIFEQPGEHLKHYLKLIFTGYKSTGRYIQARVSKERIRELLGYTTINGVYKLFQKLSGLGLTVFRKGKLFAIYFESYKVIDIQEYREAKKTKASREKSTSVAVAGGEPLVIPGKYTEDRGSPDTG